MGISDSPEMAKLKRSHVFTNRQSFWTKLSVDVAELDINEKCTRSRGAV
jgi:hypothetical protein